MRKIIFVSALLFAFSAQTACYAHHNDPTGELNGTGDFNLNASTGILIEPNSGESPQILVAVQYHGIERHTGNHHVTYRYFWVSGQVFIGTGDDAGTVPSFRVNIVPVSKIMTSHTGVTTAIRAAPIEISRDVDIGLNAGVKIQAIGYAWGAEAPLVGSYKEGEQAKFVRFAQIAVDLLGIRYAQFEGAGHFVGMQAGSASAQAGLGWNLNKATSLRLAIGGQADFAGGSDLQTGRIEYLTSADLYSKIALLLKTKSVAFQLGVQGGYHVFNSTYSDGSGETHGHPFILITVGCTI